jgi:REP element-mobilizing transposase RayT
MIMPDHMHFLVHIDQQQEQKQFTPEELEKRAGAVAGKHMNKPGSLGAIVRGYKGAVTRQVLETIKAEMDLPNLQSLELIKICDALANEKTIWVRNYNEAIIKTEQHYENVTKYINDNPRKWDEQLKAKLKL